MSQTISRQATVIIYRSRKDMYAKVYWAMVYVDHRSGQFVRGTAVNRSTIVDAFPDACIWDTELPIREFKKATKEWGDAGCTCNELQAYVQKGLQ